MAVEKILADWKKGIFKTVYWLEGEETYFIDKVVDYAEHNILNESEAGFNLTVFYGRDADWKSVVNACRRYPMFADRQVVLLKEAQQMKEIEKLQGYITKPLSSTILIIAYKDKKLDGRTSFSTIVKKNGELFHYKKLYESQLPEWTRNMISSKGYDITPGALHLLIDNIGNDLNRLENEVDKVCINLGGSRTIDENAIEKYVGISKEFNVFELQGALGKKDLAKAIRIIQYFEANPKNGPIQLLLPSFYSYFSKVYAIYGMDDKSENSVKTLFSYNAFAAKEALVTAKTFGIKGVERVLLLLHEYNLRSIGIHDGGTAEADLLKEMAVKMVSQ